ncbi:hypothetical protein [Thioclava sp. JE_KL1]|uniref:hypothetical protein n=1 Tax=Thioclava sp. JE_KL1 TaxID=2651187 RepID=UPI00128D9098|nr:hypothetical protein [Thioclava sp. JE_KL1]MPQ95251.1 hypothetical protein [Thioclava sp. JE_KL1]
MGFERFTPRLAPGSRVLIVGAGPSATAPTVSAICSDFDVTITLNAAWKVAPEADVISYEFAFRDTEIFERQKQECARMATDRLVFKPHALMMLPRGELAAVATHFRIGVSDHCARFVPHNNLPGAVLANRPELLTRGSKRLPIQWKGSLTMWLDLCWLSRVGTIGLIGTDLGSAQADGRFIDHPTNASAAAAPPLLDTLEMLHRHGYLAGISFHHFHGNTRLRAILD